MVREIMKDPFFLGQKSEPATKEDVVMFNPRILSAQKPFETEEGCLSLTGVRKTTRYEDIEVEFRDMDWKLQRRAFTGWTAQIIQHEVDHCNGIVI